GNPVTATGIDAEILNPSSLARVSVLSGSIYAGGHGIFANNAGAGDVVVNTLSGSQIVGVAGDGIRGLAATGNVTIVTSNTNIDNTGNLSGSVNASGIKGQTSSGDVTIVTTGTGSIGNFTGTELDYGINASSASGNITISNVYKIGFA